MRNSLVAGALRHDDPLGVTLLWRELPNVHAHIKYMVVGLKL